MSFKPPQGLTKFLASDNLPTWFPLHHFNEPRGNYKTGLELIDFKQPSLWLAGGMILFNPIFWNLVARNEYHNKTLTKLSGSAQNGCYLLAFNIFSLGILRDALVEKALREQPQMAVLAHFGFKLLGWTLLLVGQILVVTSIYALGITGTYLGDYFGILMSHRVTNFPFNILSDPMYVGSSLAFLGGAFLYQSPVGILLAGFIWTVYSVALKFEGPFTDKIYSAKHKKSTASAPPTPSRKSARIASQTQASAQNSDASGAEDKPTTTPRRRKIGELRAVDSPARATRSRSKGSDLE
ncbi:hypothetical protein M231_04184 [Tremella mesenterica]|uniref:Phosphatidyl-N-methylethanolamine N-methyltransferase n=1 Tax=Tremella mesenterica TaxID=5217 RepID=A0A4Q1BLM6_TREME|nr:hypothetical protein M231_04184 [Tremella mesenterica]